MSGLPLLILAVEGGDESIVCLLVKKGANIKAVDLDNILVLLVVVYKKSLAIVQLLLNKDVDIKATNPQGRMPLI